MKKIAVLFIFSFSFQAKAAVPNFEFFCNQLLQREPSLSSYSEYFTKAFQKAVPLEQLKSAFSDLYADTGKCVSMVGQQLRPREYRLVLTGEKKIDALLLVTFEESSELVSGLLVNGIDDPSFRIQTWVDVESHFLRFDPRGKLSVTLKTSDSSIEFTHNSFDVLAIGSTFKLYILGALQRAVGLGVASWNEILPIREEWKSLPSGLMQSLPAGEAVKLYEYAEKMISISDNTATDHLLHFLGRDEVANMLARMGNNHGKLSEPFLATNEMFKLKWAVDPVKTQNYLRQDVAGRIEILQSLKEVPLGQVGKNGVDWEKPTLINELEWFATTTENCEAMFWLANTNNPEVRSILSKNVPFVDFTSSDSHWAFAGYKGGSEPGVISMTFLLESKKGNRACLSVSWNNETETVSRNRFLDVVSKLLIFSKSQIP